MGGGRRLRQVQAVRPAETGLLVFLVLLLQHDVGTDLQHRAEGRIDVRLAEIVANKVPE
jgi:hypothetical protein